jgi:hypothetical protein
MHSLRARSVGPTLLCALLAVLTIALAGLTLAGIAGDALLALPVLLVLLPLLAGRYIGEERLARIAAAFVSSRRRRAPLLAATARRVSPTLPRGGRLIAASLAVRPPPALRLT